MNIVETINNRLSTRSFKTESIGYELLEKIRKYSEELEVPFNHSVEICCFKASPSKKLYTVFNAPEDNIAFISETDYVSISKAGFIGELLILYATSLGISTCWYGHYHLGELEQNMPHLGVHKGVGNKKFGYGKGPVEGRRTICISPLAYWNPNGLRLLDRIQKQRISYNRKPIEELLVGELSKEDISPKILFALDLARKAPSAGNGQFWRFEVMENQKKITVAMPIGYKHIKWEHPNVDIGIAACHLWLGLLEQGITSNITVHEDQGRAVWTFDLDM
ncbi:MULTISPECIES: nitroreductase family protein [unclassified Fusibacter]|uniref:nitroreductase family protein n=1 Tax=unclassified Fusibacter TaxID=2624464 RepID=UPI0010102595|nr:MULTISPECIES: nitroreductase family protein [unclassified Fusibacter]MCK8060724.1 hypothetical protein [Fusibacter sp. A2]NPE23019.1 hypothetical protein [Fusibacter sp. A1]RXV59691.1 hypothetical protein DWB64_14330 [Fusibacter sp. A1]